LVPPPTKFY